jgi:hypothetical protein
VDAAAASFSIASALLPAREGTASGTAVVARLSGLEPTESIASRIAEIHKLKSGTLFRYSDGSSTPVSGTTLEEFASALAEGACWLDEARPKTAARGRPRMLAGLDPSALHNAPHRAATIAPAATVAPVPMLKKLWAESKLYAIGAGPRAETRRV